MTLSVLYLMFLQERVKSIQQLSGVSESISKPMIEEEWNSIHEDVQNEILRRCEKEPTRSLEDHMIEFMIEYNEEWTEELKEEVAALEERRALESRRRSHAHASTSYLT